MFLFVALNSFHTVHIHVIKKKFEKLTRLLFEALLISIKWICCLDLLLHCMITTIDDIFSYWSTPVVVVFIAVEGDSVIHCPA